jgi:hypothetical protein
MNQDDDDTDNDNKNDEIENTWYISISTQLTDSRNDFRRKIAIHTHQWSFCDFCGIF